MTLPSGSDPPGGMPRLICRCIGVSSLRIVEAVQGLGPRALTEVQKETGAGTGCGCCHPEIAEILSEPRG